MSGREDDSGCTCFGVGEGDVLYSFAGACYEDDEGFRE